MNIIIAFIMLFFFLFIFIVVLIELVREMKEFCLSDKIGSGGWMKEEDIKEFIYIVLTDCSEAFESNELEIVEKIIKKRASSKLSEGGSK